jgi:uncharacterized protein YdeI (YjbR/CyaY-like superfamily)
METNKGVTAFYASDRKQWRKWLERNSSNVAEVYLILYNKQSSTKSVSYAAAVEEALCFGWIDSLTNKRDGESRYQRFSPRKPGSNWSTSNIERAERMIAEGRMTTAGQAMIDVAKEKGKWKPGS